MPIGTMSFPFTQVGLLLAPAQSGVYALHAVEWIYVGESQNINARLLQHLNGDTPCINRMKPTSFCYELVPAFERIARQNALILELRPACNQKLG